MSREEEIDYAAKHGIPVPVKKESPFNIDQNLWGRSIECGVLEDPWAEPPEEAFEWTVSPDKAPDEAAYVEISFDKGVPVAVDGKDMSPVELVSRLNKLAGRYGFGRIDHVEDRLVGIKSREVYECPASLLLIKAHRHLESLTLPREVLHFKYIIEQKYGEIIYSGLWFSPLRKALDAFVEETQEVVKGTVRLKLFKGSATVVGRKSLRSLYDMKLSTYAEGDIFDHKAAVGFISLWGLPTRVYARVNKEGL